MLLTPMRRGKRLARGVSGVRGKGPEISPPPSAAAEDVPQSPVQLVPRRQSGTVGDILDNQHLLPVTTVVIAHYVVMSWFDESGGKQGKRESESWRRANLHRRGEAAR